MPEPFVLTLDVAGEKQLLRSFSRFNEHMGDLREPFETIANQFQDIEAEQFESVGARGGHWKPLSSDYAIWKARHYPGKPLMVRTGLLKESLLGQNPWMIRDIQAQTLTLGTKIPYAIYHQKGGGNLPQRKLINLTDEDKLNWAKVIHIWVTKFLNKEFKPK